MKYVKMIDSAKVKLNEEIKIKAARQEIESKMERVAKIFQDMVNNK